MLKVVSTVFLSYLVVKRIGSDKSKSATTCSMTCSPKIFSTSVPLVFEALSRVISALCRNAPDDTLIFANSRLKYPFSVRIVHSTLPLALGC